MAHDLGLGVSAETFYQEHLGKRTSAVQLGRRLADIIIPSVFPEESYQTGEEIAITNQSISAGLVNTLASKCMLAAFPPGLPMAKHTPIESKLGADIKADPELWGEIQYALSRRMAMHQARLEATGTRTAYTRAMRLNIVTGNGLVLWTDINKPVVHNMHSYVVKRSNAGEALVTVLKETIPWALADEDVRAATEKARAEKNREHGRKGMWEEEVSIFHVQVLTREDDGTKEFCYWQEAEGGAVIADTEAYAPYDCPIMYPFGMIHEVGSDWFLPYAMDYEGDHQAVETYASSSQDMAAASAWNLMFVDPSGQTDLRDVQGADNLDVLPGRADDVTTLQNQKGSDYRVVQEEFQAAARRLVQAYASYVSIQRNGERVTAEEWQKLTYELDQAMGGLFAELSQTLQRYFVLRFIHLHEMEDKALGDLPEGLVQVSVVTGIDSLGQTAEGARLREAMAEAKEVLGEALATEINPSDYLRRLFANKSIKSEGLVKSGEEKAADQQKMMAAQQQQTLLEKGTAPIATAGAGMLGQMIQQKMAQGET